MMTRLLGVSRSGYYACRSRGPSERAKADERLGQEIEEVHRDSRRTYGSPRITAELRTRGHRISRKRVCRLMAQRGLRGTMKAKFRNRSQEPSGGASPNRLQRRFAVEVPDKAWVGDITSVMTGGGWLHLAVVIDLFSRRVVGWSAATHMRAELVVSALEAALGSRTPSSEGLMHHSDQGCQYTSHRFQAALAKAGLTGSMSRRGNCWDNAVAESFFATLKRELVSQKIFLTPQQARTSMVEWIEVFYNRQRRHSTLGYRTPVEYEDAYYAGELEVSCAA